MPAKKAKTYGKKRAPTSSASSSFIWAAPSPVPARLVRREVVVVEIDEEEAEATEPRPSSPQPSLPSFDHQSPGDVIDVVEEETLGLSRLNLNDGNSPGLILENNPEDTDFVDPALEPLNQLFSTEQFEFCNSTWAELLPGGDIMVVKIAEASFAEVYRVETPQGSSIVKIMPLMVPSDLESYERTNASKAEDVVPELQIMDELTEIPGFVKFKKAWLVKGKQSQKFVEAWEKFQSTAEEESEFAHPASYGPKATFLAIELDDAGEVLENFLVDTWDKFWQIFLGVVLALATAEQVNDFEHRDLHENNICVLRNSSSNLNKLDITLIDYGLSRAKFKVKETTRMSISKLHEGEPVNNSSSDGRIAFKDLEQDLEIFQGPKGELQFETYRQMRVSLYNGSTKKMPMKFHKDPTLMAEAGKTWEEFTPYTNVLWLTYIFQYLSNQYTESLTTSTPSNPATTVRKDTEQAADSSNQSTATYTSLASDNEDNSYELAHMEALVKEMKKLFGLTKAKPDGAFKSAGEVFLYCVEQDWLGDDGSISGPPRPSPPENIAALAALSLTETTTTNNHPKDHETKKVGTVSTRGRDKIDNHADEPQLRITRSRAKSPVEDLHFRALPRGRGRKCSDKVENTGQISRSSKRNEVANKRPSF